MQSKKGVWVPAGATLIQPARELDCLDADIIFQPVEDEEEGEGLGLSQNITYILKRTLPSDWPGTYLISWGVKPGRVANVLFRHV